MNNNLHQSVIITLSDGTIATFTGESIVFPGDSRTVVDIKFTEPRELPNGYYFEEIKNDRRQH